VRIAISGVGKRVQLIRLARSALESHTIVTVDSSPGAPALVEGEIHGTVLRADHEEFGSSVATFVASHKIDAWISVIDSELLPLSRINSVVAQLVLPDVPDSVMDKFLMYRLCSRLGIPSPETYLEPPEYYPFIAKDRCGSASSGFRVVTTAEELLSSRSPGLVFQPLLEGRHLDVDFYVDFFTHKLSSVVAREISVRHLGETFVGRFVPVPEGVVTTLEALSASLGLRGPNNADFMEIGGVPMLLDVNARFGGNYPATHVVGHDYFRLLADNLNGVEAKVITEYPTGLTMRKYFQIEVSD